MGQQIGMFLQPPPPGSVTIVVESGECCAPEACCGRKFDEMTPQPPFCDLSSSVYSSFMSQVGAKIKQYRPEGWGALGLVITFGGFILFHPSIGPVGRSLENFSLAMILMFACTIGGIIILIITQVSFRNHNATVDRAIENLCRRTSTSNCQFLYQTAWTGACKPKGARTYRALVIAPGGLSGSANVPGVMSFGMASGVGMHQSASIAPVTQGVPVAAAISASSTMRVNCPPGSRPGDTVQIMAPSGQALMVTVPAGVGPGGQFDVQMPSAPVPVVEAVAVPQ